MIDVCFAESADCTLLSAFESGSVAAKLIFEVTGAVSGPVFSEQPLNVLNNETKKAKMRKASLSLVSICFVEKQLPRISTS